MRNLFALIGRLREQNGGFADRFVAAHTPAPTNTEDEKEDEEEEAEGSEADEEEAEGSEPEGDGSPEHEEPEHDSKGLPEKKSPSPRPEEPSDVEFVKETAVTKEDRVASLRMQVVALQKELNSRLSSSLSTVSVC